LEAQGAGGSSPENDGTGRYCQTAWVRQARREGVVRGRESRLHGEGRQRICGVRLEGGEVGVE
jgi:hypothetical protein